MTTRHSLRPSLETLEARDVPAGTVSATFANGRLTITGDAAANALLIRMEPEHLLTITDNGTGTQIRLNGGPVADAVTLPAPVTGAVVINLGDGADDLFLDGVGLPGSLTINGGNGSGDGLTGNSIRLQNVQVGGNLAVTNLAGEDNIYLWGLVGVGGGLCIRNGSGRSTVFGDYTTDLRVGGVFAVTGGAGVEHVDLYGGVGVAVGGLAFNSGTDHDGSFYVVHPFGDLTVAGSIRLTNGPGPDSNDLGGHNVTIGGAVVVNNGDGGSSTVLRADSALAVGQVTITNGAGYDDNTIQGHDSTLIRGNVRITNGAGIGANSVFGGNLLSVGGSVTFVNGNGHGLHLNTVYAVDARVAGAVTVRSGDGDTDTSVAAVTRLAVGGAVRVVSGTGADQVTIGIGRVADAPIPTVDVGPIIVNSGDGGSQTAIVGSRLTVRGPVDVVGWEGTDQVVVGSVADGGSVGGHLFIQVGPGDHQAVGVGGGNGGVLSIGGALGIWADDSTGGTLVGLTAVDVRSWTQIATGDGADTVLETGSTFRGEFDLDLGAGDDAAYLEWAGGTTNFRGPVWVSTGDGNDQVAVAVDDNFAGQVVFAGATHWDGGDGTDFLVVNYGGTVFAGPDPATTGFEAVV